MFACAFLLKNCFLQLYYVLWRMTMKNEMQEIRHTIWAVGFFLATIYLMYHREYFWGFLNMVAMVFHDLLSLPEDKGK